MPIYNAVCKMPVFTLTGSEKVSSGHSFSIMLYILLHSHNELWDGIVWETPDKALVGSSPPQFYMPQQMALR